jgi:hypothetical protein
MLLAPEVERFVAWFAALQGRIDEMVRGLCTPVSVPALAREGAEPTAAAMEWGQWLDASAHPELLGMREWVARSRSRLQQEHPVAAFAHELAAGVEALPEHVVLPSLPVDADDHTGEPPVVEVPLRRWLALGFVLEATPAFERLEQTLMTGLSDIEGRIDELERVLDYYTLAVRRHAADVEGSTEVEEFAHTGLARVQALIAELHRQRAAWARRSLARFVDHTSGALQDALAPFAAHRPDELLRRLEALEVLERAGPPSPGLVRRLRTQAERGYHAALPFARQLASELQALFTEQEPEPLRRAYRSLLATDPDALGSELPSSYRRLFAAVPLELADMYIHRPALEDACAAAIATWTTGVPQTLLLHGDRGVGKRTLVNHVLSRVSSRAALDMRWIRLGPSLCDEPAVARVLGRALGLPGTAGRFADVARPPAHEGRHRAIVIENAERLLSPSPEGIARMAAFLSLVGETARNTLWILLMATPAATLLLHRLELANRIPTVLHVEPMDVGDLRAMIDVRHRRSGFDLTFVAPIIRLLDRVRYPVTSFRAVRSPSDGFITRLLRLTGGNPRQALYYWLASSRPHPQQEGRIVVQPLPAITVDLLLPLTLGQRLILAQLAQHGSLGRDELQSVLAAAADDVEGDLKVLWVRGYVAPSRELSRHWMLRPTIAHPLLLELRAANMI